MANDRRVSPEDNGNNSCVIALGALDSAEVARSVYELCVENLCPDIRNGIDRDDARALHTRRHCAVEGNTPQLFRVPANGFVCKLGPASATTPHIIVVLRASPTCCIFFSL